MKRRRKPTDLLFMITASFLTVGSLVLFLEGSRVGDSCHFGDVSVENPDQNNVFIDQLNELRIVESNGFCNPFPLESFLPVQLPLVAFQKSSSDAKALALRC
jgi:hypothetical protein